MKKNEAIKATLITTLLISTTLAILAIPGTYAYTYPDMEYKYSPNSGDALHGVFVGVMGWYQQGVHNQYRDTQHSAQRNAIWPDQCTGNLNYVFETDSYRISSSTSDNQKIYSRTLVYSSYVYSWCSSYFTNALLGGSWMQSAACTEVAT